MGLSIFRSQIGILEKLYLFFVYFMVRKFATHCVTLSLFVGVVPMSMFLPVHVPFWALVYVPIAVSLSTVAFTGVGGFFHCVTYVLFENCMSLVRSWAGVTAINRWDFSIFLFLQGGCFLAFGLNMVDADAVLGRADSFKVFASKKAGKLRRQVSAPY